MASRAADHVPCPCPRCNGTLVCRKTFSAHKKKHRPVMDIPSLEEWESENLGESSGGGDLSEGGTESENEESTEEEAEDTRPLKRARVSEDGSHVAGGREQGCEALRGDESEPEMLHDLDSNTHEDGELAAVVGDDMPNIEGAPVEQDGLEYHPFAEPDADQLREQRNVVEQQAAQALAAMRLDDDDNDPNDLEEDMPNSRIEHVRISQQFIKAVSEATLDNGNLDEATIERLRNPEEGPVDVSDPDIRLSIDLFMACEHASEKTYSDIRDAILRRFPDQEVLTYGGAKSLVATLTGIVAIPDDMCINSCSAFTGPFEELENCSYCNEPRYDPVERAKSGKLVPRKQACSILLGPQLQARRRSQSGSEASGYMQHKIDEIFARLTPGMDPSDLIYDDIFCGDDLLDLVERLQITGDDTPLMFSLDGAQLYHNKKSDCWIGIWIVIDRDPTTRYLKKSVLQGLIIPGPGKPKHTDSFLFRTFHHLSALQREKMVLGYGYGIT